MGRHHRTRWVSWILWMFASLTLLLWCGGVFGAKGTPRRPNPKRDEKPERSPLDDIRWNLSPPQACPAVYQSDKHFLLLVSTLDGALSAIDMRTEGDLMWSLKVDKRPLLSSSIGNIMVSRDGESFRLIPGLNGGLYQYDGQSINKFPMTAESLLSSSMRITDNSVFVGGKDIGNYWIDVASGQVSYRCTSAGCEEPSEAKSSSGSMLVISHTLRTVRAVDVSSGGEKWNFSVGQHELAYIASSDQVKPGLEQDADADEQNIPIDEDDAQKPNCTPSADDSDLHEENLAKKLIRAIRPTGEVVGMKAHDPSEMAWSRKFQSPIVNMWFLHHGKLELINLFDHTLNPGLSISDESEPARSHASGKPGLFLGIHNNQMYVQEQTTDLNTCKSDLPWMQQNGKGKTPLIRWKPYKNMVHTPLLQGNRPLVPLLGQFELPDVKDRDGDGSDTSLSLWHDGYPFDSGYYLYAEYDYTIQDGSTEEESAAEEIFIVVASLSVWWKEVLTFGLLMAVVFQMIVTWLSPPKKLDENNSQSFGSNTRSSDSLASSDSSQQLEDRAQTEFNSRFASDYECIKCLGKGGYGIVYQAKYKMDEQEYAIKRIAVPNSDGTVIDKIRREVRVLAMLDHVGIVRYFHSWMEKPPLGWQEERDKHILADARGSGDWLSPTPTLDTSITSGGLPTSVSSALPSLEAGKPARPAKQSSLVEDIMPLGINGFGFDDISRDTAFICSRNNGSGEFSLHSNAEWTGDQSGSFSVSRGGMSDPDYEYSRADDSIVFQASDSEDSAEAKRGGDTAGDTSRNRQSDIPFRRYCKTSSRSAKPRIADVMENSDSIVFQENSNSVVFEDHSNSVISEGGRVNPQDDYSSSVVFEDTRSNHAKSDCFDQSVSATDSTGDFDSKENLESGHRYAHFTLSSNRNSEPSNTNSNQQEKSDDQKDLKQEQEQKGKKKVDKASIPKLFLYIQMQLCRLETLKDWLLQHKDRDIAVCVDIFGQIVSAVDYVHAKGLIHRDLKPTNIFFALDGTVKVGDFGLVTGLVAAAENQLDLGYSQSADSKAGFSKHTADVGTQLYMSPEQIQKKPYDQKVDIFSLGLILLELLVPFSTGMERITTLQKARKGIFPDSFRCDTPDVSDLVRKLLSIKPERRPTTQEILDHSLLQSTVPQRPFRFRTVSGSSSDPFLPQKDSDE